MYLNVLVYRNIFIILIYICLITNPTVYCFCCSVLILCVLSEVLSKFCIADSAHQSAVSDTTAARGKPKYITSDDISIYVDVWCSLNGRFQQRMFDPNYDLLKANWSPFEPVEWLKPILSGYNDFRQKMIHIQEEVYAWSNYSDVLFIADFPGIYKVDNDTY